MESGAERGRRWRQRRRLLEHETALRVALEQLRDLLGGLEREGLDEAVAELGQAVLRLEDAWAIVSLQRTALEAGREGD